MAHIIIKNIGPIKHVELDLNKINVFMGPQSSGKSTIAKLCNGINIPQSGKVLVEGIDTADEEKINDIRQKVGMVFQNPDNQLVATVVEEDVAFGPENLGLPREEIRRRVTNALNVVSMQNYANHAPHKLSGGQKQRIAIAGVIAMRPDVLVLDEPTAMLDPKGRREVMETVSRLNKEKGITVVLITHHMEEAMEALSELTGRRVREDVTNRIFARFCVGK